MAGHTPAVIMRNFSGRQFFSIFFHSLAPFEYPSLLSSIIDFDCSKQFWASEYGDRLLFLILYSKQITERLQKCLDMQVLTHPTAYCVLESVKECVGIFAHEQ